MITPKSHNKKKNIPKSSDLATEGPLSEKDEEDLAIERTKKLQQEARENWKREKKKDS
ncbi:MAG: hypothetical protein JWR50_2781 [Mucilaginibacter sp.]|nr:hypothetical protein [Mucilaginibacter sp.]